MYGDEDRDAVSFLSGLLLGGLIGAGVALLFAPRSGRATRKRLVRLAEEVGDSAGEGLQRAAADAKRLAERARERIEDSGAKLRERVEDSGEKLRERIEDSGEKLTEAVAKGRKRIKV